MRHRDHISARHLLTVFILILMPAVMALQAQKTQDVNSLRSQREKTLQELEKTQQMLKETKKSETATVNKLTLLNKDIKERKRLINNLNSEIRGLDRQMDDLSQRRDSLQNNLERLKADYAKMVRESHYTRKQASPLLFILSAKDFQQMLRRIRYMQEFQAYRKLQAARIRNTQQEIDIQNSMLQESKSYKEDAVKTQKRQQENLARDEKKQQAMLSSLKKKEKELIAQQKKQQKKANDLNKKIEQLIAQEIDRHKQLTKEQALLAGGFEKNKGRLPWPVEKGFISGHFGVQPHPTLERVTVNNKGVYLQTVSGAQARAVFEGEVSSMFLMGGTTAVIIQHGNYRTVYSGLKSVSVKKGDKVTAKQQIGVIYSDPDQDNSTLLFFQVWRDKEILNPELWLAK